MVLFITSVFALLDNNKMFEKLEDLYSYVLSSNWGRNSINANTVYLQKSPVNPKTTKWSVLSLKNVIFLRTCQQSQKDRSRPHGYKKYLITKNVCFAIYLSWPFAHPPLPFPKLIRVSFHTYFHSYKSPNVRVLAINCCLFQYIVINQHFEVNWQKACFRTT